MPTPGNAWREFVWKQPPGLTIPVIAEHQLPPGFGEIPTVVGSLPAASSFDGENVFGDPAQFTAGPLNGTPAAVDGWLGLSPGTTVYGAGSGQIFGLTGVFVGASSAACTAQLTTLQSFGGFEGNLIIPSGETFAQTAWQVRRNCRILAPEVVGAVGGPTGGGANWSLPFWCCVREACIY